MKKCPPGIICIENVTLIAIVIILFIIGYYASNQMHRSHYVKNSSSYGSNTEKIIVQNTPTERMFGLFQNPGYSYSNIPGDVYLNPYAPPAQQDVTMIPPPMSYGYGYGRGRVPINISTNVGAVNASYSQVGILTPLHGSSKDNILPLMGRPVNTSRQKYQYYTISNQHNNVKLPIIVKGRSGTTEYGVDELFSGDRVFVEGNNEPYKVTAYSNDTMQYIPYI